jgi:hypothetical protein
MELEKLLLTKEEIPIIRGRSFILPIHPALLSDDVRLDPFMAQSMFPQAAKEWFEELKAHTDALSDEVTKGWYREAFLSEGYTVRTDPFGRQSMGRFGLWEDLVINGVNGFATTLSINRNAGGSLYLPHDDKKQYICPPMVNFTREKFDEFCAEDLGLDYLGGTYAFAYDHHNIDHFPGALFLRNWALLYLNEAMRSVREVIER